MQEPTYAAINCNSSQESPERNLRAFGLNELAAQEVSAAMSVSRKPGLPRALPLYTYLGVLLRNLKPTRKGGRVLRKRVNTRDV